MGRGARRHRRGQAAHLRRQRRRRPGRNHLTHRVHRRWDLEHYRGDIVEHSRTGLLVRGDPDGTVTVLRDGLKFDNGFVLAPDASHLLVAETAGYRISRHRLTGPKAGTDEAYVENLAGLPDNEPQRRRAGLGVDRRAPQRAAGQAAAPAGFPGVLLWNLPQAVRPKATPVAWTMAFDLDGRIVHDLRAGAVSYGFVTRVTEHMGTVLARSLHEDDIVVLARPGELNA
ncbi:hypothetical protein ABT404_27825 [Streptomyces hyaluromycini]|uniref:Strictosidine synthase conserved region domain-containing protein n=1 Tax=Streptomyces hyaluromycini TaxID=1377993 RepID=A0ABV1X2J5_9ACTN